MRPDRSIVIGHGIVARLAAGDRADAPTGERCFVAKRSGYGARMLRRRDTREKTVPRVRGSHSARLLAPVQGKRISRNVVTPKRFLESATERFRLFSQFARTWCVTE